jgi:hypothetical protein
MERRRGSDRVKLVGLADQNGLVQVSTNKAVTKLRLRAIGTMSRTILCQKCGVLLNLPAFATIGKKLKCPKCGTRFAVSEADLNSQSTHPAAVDADILATRELRRPTSADGLPIPTGELDLRARFGAPMGTSASVEKSAAAGAASVLSDAEALFQDQPLRKRKLTGAEARAQSRRCVQCGGHIPIGMSICVSCGVDQETGTRAGPDDDLAPPPAPPPPETPLHIAIMGFLCGLAAVMLLILAIVQSVRSPAGISQYGWFCLVAVASFGIFGAVQFLMGRSVKHLMLALTLGVLVNLASLIAMPIYQANFDDQETVLVHVAKKDGHASYNDEGMEIKPIAERLDKQKITLGLIVILLYALLSVYLMSPPVKRHFAHRSAALAGAPIPMD